MKFNTLIKILGMSLVLLLNFGCESQSPPSKSISIDDTQCASGVAQIIVYDGFQKRVCGCNETADTFVYPPTSLTCTVSAGTTVYFHFVVGKNPNLKHQIRSIGTPEFAPSQVILGNQEKLPMSHAVKLSTSGTYLFQDTYFSSVDGQIVVL